MRKIIGFMAVLLIVAAFSATQAQARDANTQMNAAYWKSNDAAFDVVVKQTPHLKMKLYVNDKNPVEAIVNNEGWATFSKVKMSGSGKISFTWIDGQGNEHPIDFTSKFNVTDPKTTFSDDMPAPVAAPAPSAQQQPQVAQPQAAPAQPSVYYKNCTAARNAGVTPLHRGDPGYAPHLDRDNDGIACE